jgi:hypothetical protein
MHHHLPNRHSFTDQRGSKHACVLGNAESMLGRLGMEHKTGLAAF